MVSELSVAVLMWAYYKGGVLHTMHISVTNKVVNTVLLCLLFYLRIFLYAFYTTGAFCSFTSFQVEVRWAAQNLNCHGSRNHKNRCEQFKDKILETN